MLLLALMSHVAVAASCPNADAAAGVADVIGKIPAAPADQKGELWASAAVCFEQLGQPHVASRAWVHAVDADPKLAKTALDGLAAIASRTGNDTTLVQTASHLPESARSPAVAAFLDLAAARDLDAADDRNGAIEKLGKIQAGSWLYVDAQYRLGRLEWERGKKDNARAAFGRAVAAEAPVDDAFIAQQVRRWRDLSVLAEAHLAFDGGDSAGAVALLKPMGGGPVDPAITWTKAWLSGGSGGKVRGSADALRSHVPPLFLPDLPLLVAGTWSRDGDKDAAIAALGDFEAQWGPVRDRLDAFLATWQGKPSDAWTTWRATAADPTLARDVLMSSRVAVFTRDFGLMAQEDVAIDPSWAPPVRVFAMLEIAKCRAESQPRAGRALIAALQSRQERLSTVTSQARRLKDETLPAGNTDAEAVRALEKPLSFLSTDWGL